MAWTEAKFKSELRKAGYRSMGQGQYKHENTGHVFECWKWVQKVLIDGVKHHAECQQWKVWAKEERTPPPF